MTRDEEIADLAHAWNEGAMTFNELAREIVSICDRHAADPAVIEREEQLAPTEPGTYYLEYRGEPIIAVRVTANGETRFPPVCRWFGPVPACVEKKS